MSTLLLLCAIEWAFRILVGQGMLSFVPNLFPFPITTGKYLAYRELGEEPDVVFMGMSPMLRVSVRHLREVLREEEGVTITAFNFAGPLHWVQFDQRLLDEIVLQIKKPKLVVYGIVPINLLYERNARSTEAFVRKLPVFAVYAGTPAARLQGALLHKVELVKYREVIREYIAGGGVDQLPRWVRMAQATDAFGDIQFEAPKRPVRRLTKYERDYIPRFRSFDALMRSTKLFDHIEGLGRFCRQRGIQLAVLSTPVHPLFMKLLPHGRASYRRFLRRVGAAAARGGSPYFDPARGGVGQPRFFQDTHHLNNAGSLWFTEAIARWLVREGLIPAGESRRGGGRSRGG